MNRRRGRKAPPFEAANRRAIARFSLARLYCEFGIGTVECDL
jgi:hypothetical protein